MILSLDNKKVKLLNKLKKKKYRQQEQLFFVEGEHLVQMALANGRAEYLMVTEDYEVDERDVLFKADRLIGQVTCDYDFISFEVAHKMKDTVTSQGIFAFCRIEQPLYNQNAILVFDGLQDPGNVGTIIRTAAAFGINNFYFTTDAVDAYNEKVIRVSQGAVFVSNLFFEEDGKDIADFFQNITNIYALDFFGEDIGKLQNKTSNYAIIVGNEGNGLNAERWKAFNLEKVTIPMDEKIESLNVAIATGIMLYQLTK